MFKSKIIDILSHVEVFYGLTRDDLKVVAGECQWLPFAKGDILIEMGKPSAGFYILVKGQVRVILPERMKGGKGHRVSEVILNTLKEGECFGEYSLIENRPGSASVIGFEAGEILMLEKRRFEGLMTNDHMGRIVFRNLLRILIRRLREKEEELDLVLIAE